jgi:hypothetical protein
MIDPLELIDTCYKLVPQAATPPPSQADMRRAISTAYYAVFHTLAASNAELIAGQPQSSMSSYAWQRVYRRLDHGRAQTNLRAALNLLSQTGENFARTFIDLQALRQEADYNPNASISRSDTLNIIAQAETAISDFAHLPQEERRLLAAQSMFDRR